MLPRLPAKMAAVLLCLALPAAAGAQTTGYDSPLLSGYGDVGAAEQAVFGAKGLGGGAGGGGAATGDPATGLDLRAPAALSTTPGGDASPGAAPDQDPASGAPGSQLDQAPVLPSSRGRAAASESGGAPIGGWDLVLAIACALALALCAAATRRHTLDPVGR